MFLARLAVVLAAAREALVVTRPGIALRVAVLLVVPVRATVFAFVALRATRDAVAAREHDRQDV